MLTLLITMKTSQTLLLLVSDTLAVQLHIACIRKMATECRFGYPKPLRPETTLLTEDSDPQLLTMRNDSLVNRYNPVQLSAWRANVDMQYCVSLRKAIEYITKYASKSEP